MPEKKKRRVKVSSQMQVRIPADLFAEYGFGSEALVVPTKHGVEFRPVKSAAAQSTDLLASLVAEGLEGDELVAAFKEQAAQNLSEISYSTIDL